MEFTRRMRPLLGTYVEIAASGDAAGVALEAAFGVIEQAASLWSFQDGDSEISRLNRQPGRRVDLSRSTVHLLRRARATMRASAGAFDCTVGGLLVGEGALPDHGGLAPLPGGEPEDLEIGPGWGRLRRPVRLTLDGIAKGFAVDLAVAAMRRQGAVCGWVNAGGDLRSFGPHSLPVHRREANGSLRAVGGLRDAAMATSAVFGAGTRGAECAPGRIVCRQGAPAQGVWTVLARSAWRADALAKVAACTPPGQRVAVVQRLGGHLVEDPK